VEATSLVGTLYAEDDDRRDAGFSIFYLGINLGALVGPLLTGLLRWTLGFHFGFALAAVGMAIGLVRYAFGRKRLAGAAREVPNPLPRARLPRVLAVAAVVVVLVVVLALTGVVTAGPRSSSSG
jgi:POT family proton-dependent oligopeptide transporter